MFNIKETKIMNNLFIRKKKKEEKIKIRKKMFVAVLVEVNLMSLST